MDYQSQDNRPDAKYDSNARTSRSEELVTDAIVRIMVGYNEQISKLNNDFDSVTEKFNKLSNDMSKLNESQQQSLRQIKKAKADVRTIRDKTIEPLAVFVGLFTFASISFSTLAQDVKSSDWICIVMLVSGMMLIFPSLIICASLVSSDNKNRRKLPVVLIVVGLLLIGVGIVIHVFG